MRKSSDIKKEKKKTNELCIVEGKNDTKYITIETTIFPPEKIRKRERLTE